MSRHGAPRNLICPWCSKEFGDEAAIENHMRTRHFHNYTVSHYEKEMRKYHAEKTAEPAKKSCRFKQGVAGSRAMTEEFNLAGITHEHDRYAGYDASFRSYLSHGQVAWLISEAGKVEALEAAKSKPLEEAMAPEDRTDCYRYIKPVRAGE